VGRKANILFRPLRCKSQEPRAKTAALLDLVTNNIGVKTTTFSFVDWFSVRGLNQILILDS